MKTIDIAVIGGGASGMMASITAAQTAPGLRIAVLERAPRVGRKLLSTGNGRCNLTNLTAEQGGYHGDEAFALSVIRRFPPRDVIKAFQKMGLRTYSDEAGRVYPLCNQAAAVLDILRLKMADLAIEEIGDFDCSDIRKEGDFFLLRPVSGEKLRARRVILCAGGMAAPKVGGTDAGVRLLSAMGHRSIPRRPALTQIDTDPEPIRALKGLRYQGGIALIANGQTLHTEQGEILFAEGGLSGIAVMQLSGYLSPGSGIRKPEIRLDLFPHLSTEERTEVLRGHSRALPTVSAGDYMTGLIHRRLGLAVWKAAKLGDEKRPVSSLKPEEWTAFARGFKSWRFTELENTGWKNAQTTGGGIKLHQLEPDTFQVKSAPGLYIVGETTDCAGSCGGFNLHWAFGSGILAGQAAAEQLGGKAEANPSRPAKLTHTAPKSSPARASATPGSRRKAAASGSRKADKPRPSAGGRKAPAKKNSKAPKHR